MDISVVSYNSNALNSGNYRTVIPEKSPLFGNATMDEVERVDTWPERGGKSFHGNVMMLDITIVSGAIATGLDEIGKWFNEEAGTSANLVIADLNNSSKQWYVDAEPLGIMEWKGNVVTVALHVADPIWKSVTVQSSTWSITSTGSTKTLTLSGNRIARPKFTITPTVTRTGGFAYKRFVAIANRRNYVYRDAFNLPNTDWNTSTLVSGGKMLSSGNDLRVFNDTNATEEYRWFGGGGINSATTRVFSNVALPPQISMTTASSISNVGAVSTITLAANASNLAALNLLAQQSYKFVIIDMGAGTNEIFSYTSVSPSTYQIKGCTRAQKGTTNQSHSAGATVRHIVGYYIYYGNSSISAPTTDDSFKPMIDLTNSTNTSHVYATFYDALYPNRTCQWTPQVLKNVGGLSEVYTATQDTFADVATEIGMAIKVWLYGTTPRAPDATLAWGLYHPAGFTTLTWSGSKYRYSTSWPTAQMQKSTNGTTWAAVATEATPASANTWGALSSHSSVALSGTYTNLRLIMTGSVAASLSNMAAMEMSDFTGTIDSNYTPLVYWGAEENNNYEDFRITNNTTSQWLEVSQQIPLNMTLTIDTETLEAYLSDGTPVRVRLDDETRAEWLPLDPTLGNNTLQWDETGVNNVTNVVTWNDRTL